MPPPPPTNIESLMVPPPSNLKDAPRSLELILFGRLSGANLKAATRRKHDQGVTERVVPEKELPRNWSEFLRDGRNKEELFRL